MAPRKFVSPFTSNSKPDLNTPHPAAPAVDPVAASVDAIVLEASPFRTVLSLNSGTKRTDRLAATSEEIAAAKAEKLLRQRQRAQAMGSSLADMPELAPLVVPPITSAGTERTDH